MTPTILRTRRLRPWAVLLAAWVLAPAAHAALIVDATFSAQFPADAQVTTLSGSFTGTVDKTAIANSSYTVPVTLTAFSLDPDILSVTRFDLSNVGLFLYAYDGVVEGAILGGTTTNSALAIRTGPDVTTDDFFLIFSPGPTPGTLVPYQFEQSIAGQWASISSTFTTGSLTITPVPEPGMLALLLTGALGTGAAVRRRRPRMRS